MILKSFAYAVAFAEGLNPYSEVAVHGQQLRQARLRTA